MPYFLIYMEFGLFKSSAMISQLPSPYARLFSSCQLIYPYCTLLRDVSSMIFANGKSYCYRITLFLSTL